MSDTAALPAADADALADRLARLEQTLAGLQNTEVLEKALAQRVLERLNQQAPPALGPAPDGYAPTPPEFGPGFSAAGLALAAVLPSAAGGGVWSRLPVLAEFRLMFRMYVDPRYRLSRVAQFGVPAVLALVFLNYVTFNWFFAIPLLGMILERVGLVVLAVALYKILSREAARYAAVLDYLARYGR